MKSSWAEDKRWLHKVLLGVGLIMLTTLLLDVLRRWIALYTGTRLAADSSSSVVRHLSCVCRPRRLSFDPPVICYHALTRSGRFGRP